MLRTWPTLVRKHGRGRRPRWAQGSEEISRCNCGFEQRTEEQASASRERLFEEEMTSTVYKNNADNASRPQLALRRASRPNGRCGAVRR